MSIHDGHRKRIKDRFLGFGLDSFQEHEVLELLLFYAIPRGDVNPAAHQLISKFGNIAGVMDAPYEELVKTTGVGANAALFLKLLPQVCRRYQLSKSRTGAVLSNSSCAGKYLLPCYCGENNEAVYMVCLDSKCKAISTTLLCRGSINSASISPRKVVETALAYNAAGVILSHNHTSGIALPSHEDIETTHRIAAALKAVEIDLVDHIIVADDDFISLADSGNISNALPYSKG